MTALRAGNGGTHGSRPTGCGDNPSATAAHGFLKFSLQLTLLCVTFIIPSIDKGKHACQRVFPALFALFALACASKPASQKAKITRKYIAGRCGAVLSEQKCVQTRKDPQRILAVLSRGLTQYGRISARQNRVCPCQSMVTSSVGGDRHAPLSPPTAYSISCPSSLYTLI